MVRAVAAVAYGGPEVISVIDVASREPGPGEVTIAVHAASVNPWDLKHAGGAAGADPAKLPVRLGNELSGVVTAVGAGATALDGSSLAVGDAVYASKVPGAQASEVTVAGDRVLRKPADRDFAEAAGLLANGTTAVHVLEVAAATEGDTVLVHGASGGVGMLLAQLARLRGIRVLGTASARNHAALRDVGVEPVEYGPGLADRVRAFASEGIVAALDLVGTDEALEVSRDLLDDPARLVTIVNFGPVLAAGGRALGSGPGADPGSDIRNAARAELGRLFAEGRLRVPVGREFPLEEARSAYEFLAEGHPGGKVVLRP